jgi:hypothetical protein
MLFFFFYKIREQEGRTGLVYGGRVTNGERGGGGERAWEGVWCKNCVHMYANGKMRPIETSPGVGGGGEFKYDIL